MMKTLQAKNARNAQQSTERNLGVLPLMLPSPIWKF